MKYLSGHSVALRSCEKHIPAYAYTLGTCVEHIRIYQLQIGSNIPYLFDWVFRTGQAPVIFQNVNDEVLNSYRVLQR